MLGKREFNGCTVKIHFKTLEGGEARAAKEIYLSLYSFLREMREMRGESERENSGEPEKKENGKRDSFFFVISLLLFFLTS